LYSDCSGVIDCGASSRFTHVLPVFDEDGGRRGGGERERGIGTNSAFCAPGLGAGTGGSDLVAV